MEMGRSSKGRTRESDIETARSIDDHGYRMVPSAPAGTIPLRAVVFPCISMTKELPIDDRQ
jgi:hypothetical protein